MPHIPRKRFGQNFLHDQGVLHQLLDAIQVLPTDNLLEIGPGQGALTEYLLKKISLLRAIEIDRDLLHYLRQRFPHNLLVEEADALAVDYSRYGENLRIVGNLPYNISTPLLFHLLHYASSIKDMHFMLQKEVVQRICSAPNSKDYGRLSVMMQYYCAVDYLFDVPPHAFNPPPKVGSAVIRLIPHGHCPYLPVSMEHLQKTLAFAFAMRRKTLTNNFKGVVSPQQLNDLGIDSGLRPENLSVQQYAVLANFLSSRT